MTPDPFHRCSGTLDGPALAGVARLARAAEAPYLVYEADEVVTFATDPAVDVVATRNEVVRFDHVTGRTSSRPSPILPAVRELLAGIVVPDWTVYGWAAFELSRPDLAGDGPLLHLFLPRTEVRLERGQYHVRAFDREDARRAVTTLTVGPDPDSDIDARPAVVAVPTDRDDQYLLDVARAVRHIGDGGLEKVVLSRRVPVVGDVDLVGTYLLGRRHNTPRRSFLFDLGGCRAAGFSPETVVEVEGTGQVASRPLAGTRALSGVPAQDRQRRRDLVTDPKEVYEHAVSVRVAVEELSRLCGPDRVRVEPFMTVEQRGSVQHLASRVVGWLPAGLGCWDAFGALFPGVTVSGVPKDAACAYIGEHESTPRGVYGGAVLTVDSSGAMDAAVALRTVFADAEGAWLRAGAGIVAPSVPERELAETAEKLASVAPYLVRGARDPGAPPPSPARLPMVGPAAPVGRGNGR